MSQHTFHAKTGDGQEVSVLAGWDRPLQGFFLVIERIKRPGDYLFCNLDVPASVPAHPKTWDYFQAELDRLCIAMPKGLMQALLADKQRDAGNSKKHWT